MCTYLRSERDSLIIVYGLNRRKDYNMKIRGWGCHYLLIIDYYIIIY